MEIYAGMGGVWSSLQKEYFFSKKIVVVWKSRVARAGTVKVQLGAELVKLIMKNFVIFLLAAGVEGVYKDIPVSYTVSLYFAIPLTF